MESICRSRIQRRSRTASLYSAFLRIISSVTITTCSAMVTPYAPEELVSTVPSFSGIPARRKWSTPAEGVQIHFAAAPRQILLSCVNRISASAASRAASAAVSGKTARNPFRSAASATRRRCAAGNPGIHTASFLSLKPLRLPSAQGAYCPAFLVRIIFVITGGL